MQTMRQLPKMALIKPFFEGTRYLCLDAPGMATLEVYVDMDETMGEKKSLEYVMITIFQEFSRLLRVNYPSLFFQAFWPSW